MKQYNKQSSNWAGPFCIEKTVMRPTKTIEALFAECGLYRVHPSYRGIGASRWYELQTATNGRPDFFHCT